MSITPLQFNPVTGLKDTNTYPDTPANPRQVFMDAPEQIRDYINTILKPIIEGKADISQPNWIEPTLENSWINYGTYKNIAYMKDTLGFVHIVGFIKGGTKIIGTRLFALPVGYRPLGAIPFPATSSDGSSYFASSFDVTADGLVKVGANVYNDWYVINCMFKAEQ